jgi:cysteine desulfurase
MPVYLDHAASSVLRHEVRDEYLAHLEVVGNPSSIHGYGQSARQLVEEAREQIAKAVDCNRSEVILTSGGTESDNLAVKGIFWQRNGDDAARKVIISAATEHHAVIDPLEWLEKAQGAEIIWLPISPEGLVDLDALARILDERASEVALITLMWANNETGVITDIHEVTALADKYGIPVHSDAVAAFGHLPISFATSGLVAMTITGHKIGAPIGVGALIVSRNTKLVEVAHGGGQERGLRSGTLSPALAKSFALAAELCVAEAEAMAAKHAMFAVEILKSLSAIEGIEVTLSRGGAAGLPNILHFSFAGCSGDSLLFLLDSAGVSVSTGSACRAGVAEPSHVLLAMGRTEAEASGCLRVSFGHSTTEAEVQAFIEALPAAYASAKKAGLSAK